MTTETANQSVFVLRQYRDIRAVFHSVNDAACHVLKTFQAECDWRDVPLTTRHVSLGTLLNKRFSLEELAVGQWLYGGPDDATPRLARTMCDLVRASQ